jgi:RNA polymerase sigma factor (sigma-70 family)
MHLTQIIIAKLIEKDEAVTRHFFFEKCRPLFVSIINNVFSYPVDYDEFVNELYLYIMENDAARLRQFEGRSSIYQWLKVVAIRFFIAKRSRMIEDVSKEALLEEQGGRRAADEGPGCDTRMDLGRLLGRLTNARYLYVIRRLVMQDAEPEEVAKELGVTVPNLYNIKKRAIAALTKIALKEFPEYETGI